MKTDAVRSLRRKLAADMPVLGLWVTLESPSITEMAVALGLDWIVVDAEHGHLDWKEIVEHVRAAVRSQTVVLVRVAERSIGLIKRALDLGADGIVVPWIETADQLREVVSYSLFPPAGVRGIGGERATCWGQCLAQHTQEANEHVLVMPVVESVAGGQAIHDMLQVEGVDLFFLGPADYSSSAGYRGQWEGPGVAEQLLAIKDAVRGAGKHVGVIATSNANLQERLRQGFRVMALGTDSGMLLRSLHDALATVGRDRKLVPSLSPESDTTSPVADRPPEAFRPDRPEVITAVGQGVFTEIGRGVVHECLVGTMQGARNLSTGLVTFAPGAQLEYHVHPYTESVALLSGTVVIEVEGRRYTLSPLDSVVIPAGLPHAAVNTSTTHETVLHSAMPTDTPSRTVVDKYYSRRGMPEDALGKAGAEYVTRYRSARRFAAGEGAEFVDYFNRDLVPDIEMSGGYGLFRPGGRLPAHVHDFDESICIVTGQATCMVEGRQHVLTNCATALQPRGRVHYFVNRTQEPMAMLWVYGGPAPERLVVAEHNCTVEGNPWKTR